MVVSFSVRLNVCLYLCAFSGYHRNAPALGRAVADWVTIGLHYLHGLLYCGPPPPGRCAQRTGRLPAGYQVWMQDTRTHSHKCTPQVLIPHRCSFFIFCPLSLLLTDFIELMTIIIKMHSFWLLQPSTYFFSPPLQARADDQRGVGLYLLQNVSISQDRHPKRAPTEAEEGVWVLVPRGRPCVWQRPGAQPPVLLLVQPCGYVAQWQVRCKDLCK